MKSIKGPDYKRIFIDMLHLKFPEKKEELNKLLNKDTLSEIDILLLNRKIFGTKANNNGQKHKAYSKMAIDEILNYQKKNNLTNTQVANHFRLSRNTVAKWKRFVTN